MAPILLPPLDIRPRAQQHVERSEGLHLSTITQDMLITLNPDKYDREKDEGAYLNFLAGIIYEQALSNAWLDIELKGHRPGLIRPGEVTRDLIIGTPDAFDWILGRPCEFKFTKHSCRYPITDDRFWWYWVQLKAYAYMLGVNSGELWVCFVNGNYSRDPNDPENGYVIKGWEDHWTDLQLKENWMMIVRHAMRKFELPRPEWLAA